MEEEVCSIHSTLLLAIDRLSTVLDCKYFDILIFEIKWLSDCGGVEFFFLAPLNCFLSNSDTTLWSLKITWCLLMDRCTYYLDRNE